MCASKPAEITMRSGRKSLQPRQDRRLERLAELAAVVAGAQRRVDDGVVFAALADARRCRETAASGGSSNTSRSDPTRKCPASRCRGARRNRPCATRSAPCCFCAWRAAIADVVEQAEAHRPRGLGVVAGRAHRDESVVGAAGSSPRRPRGRAPPTARIAASKLPGDIEVSASSAHQAFVAAWRRGSPRRNPSDGRARCVSNAAAGASTRASVLEALVARAPASIARSRSGRSGWPSGVRCSRQAGWVMRSVVIAQV